MNHNYEESEYLNLLSRVLNTGKEKMDRTGVGTWSIHGAMLEFSLKDNTIPLLTTKKVFWRGVVEELLFFMRGGWNTKSLEAAGVNIWKGNTSRAFLDSHGFKDYNEGEIGPAYGYQWRQWNHPYTAGQRKILLNIDGEPQPSSGIDQLAKAIETLKTNPMDRRIIVSAWNPEQIPQMVLPPCHLLFQFLVDEDRELTCLMYQRSVDTVLGLPFNLASYALLTHIVAKMTGLKAAKLVWFGADVHIYKNHQAAVLEQFQRDPRPFPKLQINREITDITQFQDLKFEDFTLVGYNPHPAIKAEMAV